MKKLLLSFALVGFAGLSGTLPVSAQDLRGAPTPEGVSQPVQLAQYYYPRRWEDRRGRRYGRPPYRCRWVTERRVRPNGTVVIRRVQRCFR